MPLASSPATSKPGRPSRHNREPRRRWWIMVGCAVKKEGWRESMDSSTGEAETSRENFFQLALSGLARRAKPPSASRGRSRWRLADGIGKFHEPPEGGTFGGREPKIR